MEWCVLSSLDIQVREIFFFFFLEEFSRSVKDSLKLLPAPFCPEWGVLKVSVGWPTSLVLVLLLLLGHCGSRG